MKKKHKTRTFRKSNYRSDKQKVISTGIFQIDHNGRGMIIPHHRKQKRNIIQCDKKTSSTLKENDLVIYEVHKDGSVEIKKNFGSINSYKNYTIASINAHNLDHEFNQDIKDLFDTYKVPPVNKKRSDYRNFPLVTIDGDDAKDFDDAVWATPDLDPRNAKGWRVIVAIADVSFYVRPNDPVDRCAYHRGNSVYFADRVVPMLPEVLSNDLCSLKPDVDRASVLVEMIISADGKIKSYKFKRALIKSAGRLTYRQVQNALDGNFDKKTQNLKTEIKNLHGAYLSLKKAREKRQAIEIESQEHKIYFDTKGEILDILKYEKTDSNDLIEELMIAANVCAAKTILAKKSFGIFRIHEKPENIKISNLIKYAKDFGMRINFKTKDYHAMLNSILKASKKTKYERLINESVLRTQSQARYSPVNLGHFGLNLSAYCHFTSPIRRYADLVIHRSLVSCLDLAEDEKNKNYFESLDLEQLSDHISNTERKATEAEREVFERFAITHLQKMEQEKFDGVIAGVNRMGIFVSLENFGVQGMIPRHALGKDFYIYNEEKNYFWGKNTKKIYQVGNSVTVKLLKADHITCTLDFQIL